MTIKQESEKEKRLEEERKRAEKVPVFSKPHSRKSKNNFSLFLNIMI